MSAAIGQAETCDTASSESTSRSGAADRDEKIKQGKQLQAMGAREAGRKLIASTAPGPTPLAAIQEPQTIAEGLATLDEQWRGMLIRAAGRDADKPAREARRQAAATLTVWWPAMPRSVTANIDARVTQWRREHPHVADRACNHRRLLMLLPHLRGRRSGTHRLGVAMRLPR